MPQSSLHRCFPPALALHIALGALLCVATPAWSGDATPGSGGSRLYYQYTDAQGKVRFTDQLDEVPPQARDRMGRVELSAPPPSAPSARAPRRVRPARSQPAKRMPQIVIYYADWCSNCRTAKAYMRREGIPFEIRDVENPSALAEMVERTGQKGIPVIDVDGRIQIGWDERSFRELLSRR